MYILKLLLLSLFLSSYLNADLNNETEDQKLTRYAKTIYKLYQEKIRKDKDIWERVSSQASAKVKSIVDHKINAKTITIKGFYNDDKVIEANTFYYIDLGKKSMVTSDAYNSVFKLSNSPSSNIIKLKYDIDYNKVVVWADNGAIAVRQVEEDLTIKWEDILKTIKLISAGK